MPVRALPRRTFLRGAGGIAMALPWLEAMSPDVARAQTPDPKRLVVFFSACGTVPSAWKPNANFDLGPILRPLDPFKSKILTLGGVDMKSAGGDHKGHNRGIGCLLTGRAPSGDGNDGQNSFGTGVSVDQYIGQRLGQETVFNTLELGIRINNDGLPRSRMSYVGPNQPVPPQQNPFAAFNRLFADNGQDQMELDRIRARRGTVLDAVLGDLGSLKPKLGNADAAKIDAHTESIRQIELRLDQLANASCEAPDIGAAFGDWKQDVAVPRVAPLQLDILFTALKCDLTRVATLMWGSALSGIVYSWLGHTVDHHNMSHNPAANAAELIELNTFISEHLADLLAKMDAVEEQDGTLLDNTLVLRASEIGKGQPHYNFNIPFVLCGSAGGFFKQGQHVELAGRSHNDLLVTLLHAYGIQENTFGDPAFVNGPITEIIA